MGFLPKMDYQTARYAAECARWYSASGDEAYKEKAYHSLNWVTYCNKPDGEGIESPVSKHISNCSRPSFQISAWHCGRALRYSDWIEGSSYASMTA